MRMIVFPLVTFQSSIYLGGRESALTPLTIVYPIKTITRYYSLPTLAAKYTHAQNVLTVAKRVERSRSIVIIKHKYVLMCNHKIHINLMVLAYITS